MFLVNVVQKLSKSVKIKWEKFTAIFSVDHSVEQRH